MTFRARLIVTFLLAVLVPMVALTLFVRAEMTSRLSAQYERRVESLIAIIEDDLAAQSESIAASLAILKKAMVDDNRFRGGAVDRAEEERRYLLDYAGGAMSLTGLSMLQIQDERGRIISSGHFRNEFDRIERELPALLARAENGTALVSARAPDAPFLALARVDSLWMGNMRFTLVAGVRVEERFLERLSRDTDIVVSLIHPGGRLPADTSAIDDERAVVRELRVPFADTDRGELVPAAFRVAHGTEELVSLRRSIDRWFIVALIATAVFAILLVSWLASRISRPLAELAEKTSRVDLDRLDVEFESKRRDEIGVLSRLLGAMTERLRSSAARLKDAERRATRGELARQVNHDIKNGLTPIRNVFRHLAEMARMEPGRLPQVFEERRGTLESSISYLEKLASNYARLTPRADRQRCDVNEIARRVVIDMAGTGTANLNTNLSRGAIVLGDPIALRRVLENLVDNAIDSLGGRPGDVVVSSECDNGHVRMTVSDTGAGMSEEQREKIFDDFYTTKEGGTGLGLSIVRRLVMDFDGSVRVESEEGRGSRFIVDLPGVE